MTALINDDSTLVAQGIALRERRMALTEREWKHRLAGYGYSLRASSAGPVLTSLVQGADICLLADAA